jgi:diguanylate cyclase (GGDEF)-like protein
MIYFSFEQIKPLLGAYGPELVCSLILIYALKYLRRLPEASEGTLSVSYAFLILAVKDFIYLLWPFFMQGIPDIFLYLISLALQTSAGVFFVLAGLQIARIPFVNKKVAPYLTVFCILSVIYVSFISHNAVLRGILPSIVLGVSCLVLGVFYFAAKRNSASYELRWMGLAFVVFSAWQFHKVIPATSVYSDWGLEMCVYSFMAFCIFYTSNLLLQKQFSLLEYEAFSSKSRLRLIIQSSPFPVVFSRLKDNRIILLNSKAEELFQVRYKKDLKLQDFLQNEKIIKEIISKLEKNPTLDRMQVMIKYSSHKNMYLQVSARIIDFENEFCLFIALQDITEQKEREALLYEQATTDSLTGCLNRRQFMEMAERELQRFWRYNTSFCLLAIDLDNFKIINDTYGHPVGDSVLQSVGFAWKKLIRASDILARMGGDEFVLLLVDCDEKRAQTVFGRLQEALKMIALPATENNYIPLEMSAGLAFSSPLNDLEKTLKIADDALYVAKKTGKNKLIVAGSQEAEAFINKGKNNNKVINTAIDNVVEETLSEINTLLEQMNKPKIMNLSQTLKSTYLSGQDKEEQK